jgi:hypothetical protein
MASSNDNKQSDGIRRVLLFIICVPIIGGLVYFAYKKNQESPIKAAQCQEDCVKKGFAGYKFQWNVFEAPYCKCLDSP